MEYSPLTNRTRLRESIKREEIEEKLKEIGMEPRDIRYLFNNTEFLQLQYRNHQVHFFAKFYFEMYHKYCSTALPMLLV